MQPQYITLAKNARQYAGKRFGRLVALGPVGKNPFHGGIVWQCRCDCGNTVNVAAGNLGNGTTKSCGCLRSSNKSCVTHGMSRSPIYKTWQSRNRRCTNPKNPRYSDYGGRGISVCAEWAESFEAFYSHVSALPFFGVKGRTLDRIDNDGNYEPGNVRWATKSEQRRNSRPPRSK
jgi:hypothetical protein